MVGIRKVYIAGPMRGKPNFNFPAFDEAAARGRALGFEIVSPAELDRDSGFNEKGQDGKVDGSGHSAVVTMDFMRGAARRDFEAIVGTPGTPGVDAVAMLEGWEGSKGAKGEKGLAEWIGLPVLDAHTFKPLDQATTDPIKNGKFVVVDSGAKTKFPTGAVRDDGVGKGFFHLIPYLPMLRLAQLYEAGAKKYGPNNWRKGINLSRYVDATYRHLGKLSEGWVDEDHAAAVIWNAAAFIWTVEEITLGRLPDSLNDIGFPIEKKPPAEPPPLSDMVTVTVEVNGVEGCASIHRLLEKHICGSHGFGQGADDRCPRCEANERAREDARAKGRLAA